MFKIVDGRTEFYQWDLNRQMQVEDNTITELHFCNKTDDCSLVVEVKDGVANVPNILLQSSWDIRVYGFTGDYTKVEKRFKVVARSKPSDYIYTETELKNYDNLAAIIESQGNRIKQAEEGAYYATLLADDTAESLYNTHKVVGTAFNGYRDINLNSDGCLLNDVVPFNHDLVIRPKGDYKVRNYLEDYFKSYPNFNETENGITLTLSRSGSKYIFKASGKSTTPTTFMIMPMANKSIPVNGETLYGCVSDANGDYAIKGAYLILCDENYNSIRVDNDTKLEGIQRIQAANLIIPPGTYSNTYIYPFITNEAINIYDDNSGDVIGFYPLYKNFYSLETGGTDSIYIEPAKNMPEDEYIGINISYKRQADALIAETQDDGFILVWGNQAFKVYAEPIEDYEY